MVLSWGSGSGTPTPYPAAAAVPRSGQAGQRRECRTPPTGLAGGVDGGREDVLAAGAGGADEGDVGAHDVELGQRREVPRPGLPGGGEAVGDLAPDLLPGHGSGDPLHAV